MKSVTLSLLFAFASLLFLHVPAAAQETAAAAQYNATVTVKIKGLERTDYVALVDAVAHTNDIGIDYACVEAGILVFKVLNTTFSSRADVTSPTGL